MISASESMFLDFDGWLKQQPGDVQDDHAVHFKFFVDPARLAAEKDRLASIEFVHEQTRRPRTEIADNWHLYRGGVAERLAEMPSGATDYKWEAVKDDDAGFAGVAREAATFQRDRRNLVSNVHRQAFEAAMSIDPELPAKRKAEVFAGLNADGVPGMNPDDLPALYRIYNDAVEQAKFNTQGERSAAREAAALVRKGEEVENFALDYLTPAVERLMKLPKDRRDLAIEFLRQDFSKGGKSDGEQVGLRMRGKRPMGVDSTVEGAALSLGRGAADVTNKLVAYGERMVEALGARDDSEFRTVESKLRELVNGTLAPLNADGMIQQGVMSAAQSLPAMAMIAAGPVGTALSVSYYQQGSYEKFKADPRMAGASDAKISAMALASGVAQSVLDKVELGILSKLPGAATILGNLRGVANPLGYVGNEAGKAVLGIAAETGVEVLQDNYTDAIAQQVGAWLSSSVASPEWAAVNAEALRSLPELAMTMIPLVTIAHGVGGVRDIHAARALASTPELLRIAGFGPSQALAISSAENPVGALRAMWNERNPMDGAPKGSTPSQVAAQAVEDYKAARDAAVSAADDARATPGVAYVQRTNAGWQVIDTDGQAHAVKSEAAVPGLLVEIGKATTIREAEAMQQIADSIGAKEPAAKQVLTGDKVTVQREGGKVQVDSALKLIPFTPATLANFNAQLSLLGADSAIVNGANWIAEDGPTLLANKSGEGILTQVHEFAESRFRSLIDNDVYFGNHAISAARVVAPLFDVTRGTAEDKAFAERVQRVASGKTNETEARETLVELVVADVLGRRKDGGSFTPGAITAGVSELINSSANPAERASLGKFRAFLRAVRAYLHGIFSTAARLSKGRRDGVIKPGDDFTTFAEKLLGVDGQKAHEKAVIAEATASLSAATPGGMSNDPGAELPKIPISSARLSELLQDIDDFGPLDRSDPYRADAFEQWRRRFNALGIREIDAYHVTDAGPDDLNQSGITGSSVDAIGRTGDRARQSSVYLFLDPDDIKPGWSGILGAKNDKNTVVHVKIPVTQIEELRWDSNFNVTFGTYSSVRILGDIPPSWIHGYFEYDSNEGKFYKAENPDSISGAGANANALEHTSLFQSAPVSERRGFDGEKSPGVNDNSASASLGSVNTLEALAVQLENRIAAARQQDSIPPGGSQQIGIDIRSGTSGMQFKHREPVTIVADHGTNSESVTFEDPAGGDASTNFTSAAAIWFSDSETAETYGKFKIPARLTFKKPFVVDYFGEQYGGTPDVGDYRLKYDEENLATLLGLVDDDGGKVDERIAALKKKGFDGFIVTGIDDRVLAADQVYEPRVIFGVFSSSQIEKLNENSNAPSSGASASLGSVNTLEALAVQLENRIAAGGATVKLEAYADTARTLEGMARAARSNESIEHVLAVGEIEKQRAAMQKRMEAQAREQIERDNSSLLGQPELADAFANEFFDYLFRKKEAGKPFRRSRILSKAAAIKQGIEIGNQYDGIDGLPKWLFSADGIVPDKITKELAETKEFGLSEEDATADADLWPRIRQILDSSEKYRKALRKIEGEMIEARAKARTESRTWAAAQRAKLAASDARDEKRSLVTLDALLANVPAEVRGRVGGFTRIAELKTNDARRKHLMAIVEKLDSEMERYLRRELVKEITATLQKGRARKVAGQKDRGPLGVNAHTWLETAERYMVMGEADLEARELYIDAILGGAEMSDAVIKELNRQWNFGTGEDAARMALEVEKGIADLFGGATHRDPKTREYTRGSGELEAAWKAAKERADIGRMEWERELEIRRTRREGRRAGLSIESGNHGRPSDIAAREKALQGFGGAAVKYFRNGFTFSEFVGDGFGREGDTHRFAEDTAMEATLTESALWQASQNGLADFLRSLWPRSGKAARLRQLEALATPKKVDGAPAWIPELSEMQAVHLTMLWQDVDSRPWLRKWQYGDGAPEDPRDPAGPDVQAVLEAHLSPQAKLIREWLQGRYDDQYDSLNDVFRRLHGVNMPRVKNYTPRMVEHGKDAAVIDPLGAGGLSARGVFSGFTKRRRINIAAAPVLADALRAYTQNQRVVTHFVAWAEASNELRAVFSTSASAPFIKGAMGNQGAEDLNQWLSDLEAGGVREAQASEIWNRWLRANTASALFGKLGVLAKQIPAAYGAAVEIGWSDYLRSLRRVVAGKAARPVSGAVASRIMQARAFDRPAEVGQASSGTGVSPWDARLRRIGIPTTGIDLAMDWLGGRIGATDAFFTARGAAIAYDAHFLDGKAQKMSDAAAHAYAERETERTISRTAQPDSVANKSLAENHAGTWGRIFNQFQSANRQALFMTLAAFRDGGMKSGDAWRKAVTHWIVTGIVTQTIGNLIRDALSDDNDDELWNLGDYGRAMMFGPTTGAVLGWGAFMDVLASFMGGFERRQAPSPIAAVTDFGKEMAELLKDDDAFEMKDGEKIGKALGSFLGGRWAALNVAANLGKQAVGFVDNLATTKAEAMESDAKKQREADKAAREGREAGLSPEQRAALKEARKHGREQRKELDAARWRAAHPH